MPNFSRVLKVAQQLINVRMLEKPFFVFARTQQKNFAINGHKAPSSTEIEKKKFSRTNKSTRERPRKLFA